jgi:hypothetical protein
MATIVPVGAAAAMPYAPYRGSESLGLIPLTISHIAEALFFTDRLRGRSRTAGTLRQFSTKEE